MMNRATGLLATLAVVLGFAGSAQASSISLLWTSVNGGAITATSSVALAPSDTAVLSIFVNNDPNNLTSATVSVSFDAAALANTGFSVCPPVGICAFPALPGEAFLTPLGVPTTPSGAVNGISAATTTPGGTSQSFVLAEVTFHYSGPGGAQVDFANIPGLDGFTDGVFTFSTIGATAPALINGGAVPEPGTLGLMALGLAALGVAGRRR